MVQREWADDIGRTVKLGRYDVAAGEWTFVSYELDAVESPAGGWVGLSEITALQDGTLAIVERDNQLGLEARVKRVYGIDPATVTWKPYREELDVRAGRRPARGRSPGASEPAAGRRVAQKSSSPGAAAA